MSSSGSGSALHFIFQQRQRQRATLRELYIIFYNVVVPATRCLVTSASTIKSCKMYNTSYSINHHSVNTTRFLLTLNDFIVEANFKRPILSVYISFWSSGSGSALHFTSGQRQRATFSFNVAVAVARYIFEQQRMQKTAATATFSKSKLINK